MLSLDFYEQFLSWYTENEVVFTEYAKYVHDIIKKSLIEYHLFPAYATSRAKSKDSLRKKCKKTVKDSVTGETMYKYTDPKAQITDMAGVRFVTYTVSDLSVISHIVEKLFIIDYENSSDKKKLLSTDRVGYLSIHFVVSLKPSDEYYEKFKTLKCEIQIRTVLQDAWAQIFHDRQYKPIDEKPPSEAMLRETHLLAATLELLDSKIDLLAQKYDSYYKIPNNKEFQYFLDNEVTEKNLSKYIYSVFEKTYEYYDYELIREVLLHFQISKIRDFDRLCDSQLVRLLKSKQGITIDYIVFYIIIAHYPQEFFANYHKLVHVTQKTVSELKEFADMSAYLNNVLED